MQEKEKNEGRSNGKENIKERKKQEWKMDRKYIKDTAATESRGRPCREKGKRNKARMPALDCPDSLISGWVSTG